MIKSLRKKFIVIAMCSIFVVLMAVMSAVNIANYYRIVKRADNMTELLAKNGGNLEMPPKNNPANNKDGKGMHKPEEKMSPETPFSTRYFTVTIDMEGNVISSDMGKIAAINDDEAKEYAKAVWEKGKIKGFRGIYRHNAVRTGDNILLVFLDCEQDLDNVKTFAFISFSVSALGLLAVLVLVLFFSKIVFRPVEESYEKQKRFITDASHEIKTPLTIIDANTEVIEMESGENQWTKSTRNQIKRLSSLTQQMIMLSKLDEGDSVNIKNEFSLSELVMDSAQAFDSMAKTQNKTLNVKVEDNINFIGEEKAISQLIGILLDNAIKYSSDNSEICLHLSKKGKKIFMEVFNQTSNIPKGNLDVLFERFYRMDSSRNSETGGSGIGLSVAKAIVTTHKGKITALSEDGKSMKVITEFKI